MIPLSQLFSSKTRIKLLSFFFAHPTERFHINGLARLLETKPSSLQKSLYTYERIGLLTSKREVNIRYYSINKNFPIYPELKNIILKTVGLGDILRKNLSKSGNIQYAFIYGSFAQGDERASSDVDLMIIGHPKDDELIEIVRKAEIVLQRDINYTIFSFREWKEKLKKETSFIQHILSNKVIPLIGEFDELQRTMYCS